MYFYSQDEASLLYLQSTLHHLSITTRTIHVTDALTNETMGDIRDASQCTSHFLVVLGAGNTDDLLVQVCYLVMCSGGLRGVLKGLQLGGPTFFFKKRGPRFVFPLCKRGPPPGAPRKLNPPLVLCYHLLDALDFRQ